jgi:hypothetical protein
MMLVDPDILRAFAAQVQTASSTITAADVAQVAAEIAKNVNDMGVAVRGARDKYELTDDGLAGSFDGLF